MVRVRSNPAKLRRKRRLLNHAKGFWGARKNLQRLTAERCVAPRFARNRRFAAVRL